MDTFGRNVCHLTFSVTSARNYQNHFLCDEVIARWRRDVVLNCSLLVNIGLCFGAVVVADTTTSVCSLSSACCCLCPHHYIRQHLAPSQQSDAMACVAHKLVLSPLNMPPAVCCSYRPAEHVRRKSTRFTFSIWFDICSVLHAV